MAVDQTSSLLMLKICLSIRTMTEKLTERQKYHYFFRRLSIK